MAKKKETNEVSPTATLNFCLEAFTGPCYEGWEPKQLDLSAGETEMRGVCGEREQRRGLQRKKSKNKHTIPLILRLKKNCTCVGRD